MSATRPNRWTGQIARVRGVIAASICFASIRYVSGSMSTKTGVAPVERIAFAVAANVWQTVITSSPGSRPIPAKIAIRASVPLPIAIACLTPTNSAQRVLELVDLAALGDHPALEDLGRRRRSLPGRCRGGRSGSCGCSLARAGPLLERLGIGDVGVVAAAALADAAPVGGVAAAARPAAGRRSQSTRRAPQAQTQPIRRAGLPTTRAWLGTSRVTTRAGPDGREAADLDAGDDDGAGPDRAAVARG